MARFLKVALIVVLSLPLGACAASPQVADTPSESPAPTLIPPTATLADATVPPNIRATLPPTFTPTFTPSITPIPSQTSPPTITPTPPPPDEFTLCNSFAFSVSVANGAMITARNSVLMTGFLRFESININFEAVNEAGDVLDFERQGGGRIAVLAYGASFPAPGRYEWTVSLDDIDGERTGLCERNGFFIIDHSELEPLFATATAFANRTPAFENTLEAAAAIIETATALAVEVTDDVETTAEVTAEP